MRPPVTFARIVALLAFATGFSTATGVRAQTLEDRLRSQLVAVTAQLRDAQSSQATLTARADTAEHARDTLKSQLAIAQAQVRKARQAAQPAAPPAELEAYRVKAEQLEQADAQTKSDLASAQGQVAQLTQALAQQHVETDRATAGLATRQTGLDACRVKNKQAIEAAEDILAAYNRVSIADVVARRDPLTGLKRVQFERLEQDYGDRLYDSRLDVQPRKPAAKTPPPK